MHINARFNIIQAESNKPGFVVIDGQRMPGGYPATGAKVMSGAPMSRDDAIQLADRLQALDDDYQTAVAAACRLPTAIERNYACNVACAAYEAGFEELGIEPV